MCDPYEKAYPESYKRDEVIQEEIDRLTEDVGTILGKARIISEEAYLEVLDNLDLQEKEKII